MPSAGSAPIRLAALIGLHLAPIAVACALVLRLILNVPFIDDYPNLFGFVLTWRHLPALQRLAYPFTAQHDEYRFTFLHLVTLTQVGLTGRINITLLSLFGDLFLVALLALLWRTTLPYGLSLPRKLLVFLPVTLLLFGLNYADGLGWPSATLDYVPALFFSFLALHLLTSQSFPAACASAIAAYLTAPNAIVLLPLGLLVLVPRKAWLQALVWCAAFALGIAPYLFHYQRSAAKHPPTTPKLFVVFFLSFLGSGNPSYRASLLVGILILLLFALSLRWGYYKSHPAAVLGALWVFGSAFLVAFGRSHAGVEFALISRYKIFSDVLLLFCYGVLAQRLTTLAPRLQTRLFTAAIAVAFLLCLRADLGGYHLLAAQRKVLAEGLRQFQSDPTQASPMHFPDAATDRAFTPQKAEARTLMQQAIQQNLYAPPALP